MTVSPVMYDVQVDQDAAVQKVIELKNDSKQQAFYTISSEDFLPSGEDGGQQYLENSTKKDLASWMLWNQTMISVQPGATVRVPITIHVPQNAESGGHYATVFFSKGSGDQNGSSVGMTEQIGVLFLVRVSGEVTERASVETFDLYGSGTQFNRLPVNFDIRIQNEGSVHFRPEGNVVIKNALGNTVAKISVNPKQGAVLPDSIRRFETTWTKEDGLSTKSGFWNEVKAEWKQFALGRYTAELKAVYGSHSTQLTATSIVFWVFPWHLGLIAVAGFVLLIVLIKIYNKCLICCLIRRCDAKRKTKRRHE